MFVSTEISMSVYTKQDNVDAWSFTTVGHEDRDQTPSKRENSYFLCFLQKNRKSVVSFL